MSERDELLEYIKMLKADMTNFRYSHDEIEAACGGELALEIRAKVMARREKIIAERVELKKTI